MRLRFAVLAAALIASASVAVLPAASSAAPHPHHNRGITIHAAPHNIIAGESVLIFGQLEGPNSANQPVQLYHRLAGFPGFTLIGTTTTNANGQYEFVREDGIVLTNRSWFVRGPLGTHSKTVHEQVAALVSLAASSQNGTTRHPLIFSGHVTPDHVGERVFLQAQKGSGDQWHTLTSGRIGPGSNYQIPYAWRTPGARDVRVVFRGDNRNTAAASDVVPIVIEQTEIPDFTIQTSMPIVTAGTPFTISGTLYQPGTTTAASPTSVSLWDRRPNGGPLREVATTTTGQDGSYSFQNLTSTTNELYQVRVTSAPARHTAVLFEGAQDTVTINASSLTSTVGGSVVFSGTVSPDKAGHVVFLERRGADNNWHVVAIGMVNAFSNYQFNWTFGTPGTKQFRVRIIGGPVNVGGASLPLTVVVSLPPLSGLPTS